MVKCTLFFEGREFHKALQRHLANRVRDITPRGRRSIYLIQSRGLEQRDRGCEFRAKRLSGYRSNNCWGPQIQALP